jgi:RNAse (barnase) inhibitor barstar
MPSRLIRTADDLDALFTLLGNMKLPLTVDWVQGADRTAQQNKLMWRWAHGSRRAARRCDRR